MRVKLQEATKDPSMNLLNRWWIDICFIHGCLVLVKLIIRDGYAGEVAGCYDGPKYEPSESMMDRHWIYAWVLWSWYQSCILLKNAIWQSFLCHEFVIRYWSSVRWSPWSGKGVSTCLVDIVRPFSLMLYGYGWAQLFGWRGHYNWIQNVVWAVWRISGSVLLLSVIDDSPYAWTVALTFFCLPLLLSWSCPTSPVSQEFHSKLDSDFDSEDWVLSYRRRV